MRTRLGNLLGRLRSGAARVGGAVRNAVSRIGGARRASSTSGGRSSGS